MSREKLSFWEHVLKALGPVIIKDGYKLPLLSIPVPFSGIRNFHIKRVAVNKCIHKVSDKPWIHSPLSVVRNSEGKEHLVLNLHYLNQYLYKESFKQVALLLFQKCDYMFPLSFEIRLSSHWHSQTTLGMSCFSHGQGAKCCLLCFLCNPLWPINSMLPFYILRFYSSNKQLQHNC